MAPAGEFGRSRVVRPPRRSDSSVPAKGGPIWCACFNSCCFVVAPRRSRSWRSSCSDTSSRCCSGTASVRSSPPTAGRRGDPRVGAAVDARQPALGLPAHRGRAERARHRRLGDYPREDPATGGTRPCRRALGAVLACVPASAGAEHARGRFLHSRDDLAAATVRALLHRARQPPGPLRRLHRKPDGRLGQPARPNPRREHAPDALAAALSVSSDVCP